MLRKLAHKSRNEQNGYFYSFFAQYRFSLFAGVAFIIKCGCLHLSGVNIFTSLHPDFDFDVLPENDLARFL